MLNKSPLKGIREPVVVLVNGRFPVHRAPLKVLQKAGFLLCTDGSADKAIAHGFKPDLIIGDLDSTGLSLIEERYKIVKVIDQNFTDLEKAIDWLIDNQIIKVSFVGITGDRDDHALANLMILHSHSTNLEIQAVTDHTTINFISGTRHFNSTPGQTVSILTFQKIDSVTTIGLECPLTNALLLPSGRGISNTATGKEFTIETSGTLLVFRNHF